MTEHIKQLPPKIEAVIQAVENSQERKAMWAAEIKEAMASPAGWDPEFVAEKAMKMSLGDMRYILGVLYADEEPVPEEGEVRITINLGGLNGEALLERCMEIADGNEQLGQEIYESVVAHRSEHDMEGDPIGTEDNGEEVVMIVPVDHPLAAKYGVAP